MGPSANAYSEYGIPYSKTVDLSGGPVKTAAGPQAPLSAAQKVEHDLAIALRRLLEHRVRRAHDHLGLRPRHMCGQRMQHLGQQAARRGAADEQGRGYDRFRIGFREGDPEVACIADQRGGIVAQQLFCDGRHSLPWHVQRRQENLEAAVDIALRYPCRGRCDRSSHRPGARFVVGIEAGIDLAAGLGQDQLAQQVRPPLRDTECDMAAARMAHQVDGARVEPLDERNHVVDMLCERIAVPASRSEEHTSELQSRRDLVCRLLLEKKKNPIYTPLFLLYPLYTIL